MVCRLLQLGKRYDSHDALGKQNQARIKQRTLGLTLWANGERMNCEKCGRNHATWEHRIYEKIKLVEIGVPLENLFIIMPDEFMENQDEDKQSVGDAE